MTVIKRVLGEGYRVFFLCAGLYAVATGLIWALWLFAQSRGAALALPVADAQLWHAHEMIFGYAGAAMGGFFLTAVPNWTNTPAARIGFLSVAAGLWLAGRIALWFSGVVPVSLVAIVDLSFVPVLALKIATQLIKRPKPQNMMFLLILILLWLGNLFVHLEWAGLTEATAQSGLRAGLFALCAMIVVLGGRITPAFTRNAMKREAVPEAQWPVSVAPLEKASLVLALALPAVVLLALPEPVAATVAVLLGAAQFLRLTRWRGGWALRQPILFALHLGLAMLGLGLVFWGAAGFGLGQEVAALHLLAIGGVGGMTLAVMSRAALGHSGRALVAPRPVALGYGLLTLTALLRWGAGLWAGDGYFLVMGFVSLLWAVVFALFSMSLWPALIKPRAR